MNDFLKLSAFELAAKIKSREITPSELLDLYIARIELVNGPLNAMVENDFVRARVLASEQTAQVAKNNSNLPPLFGVPFTIKEMLAVTGMKRTGGSIHHRHDVMDFDATIVKRIKEAGAIPLGTTNVPELGFWFETFNPVYGRTNNPYDLDRTCGGSSGGEAALLGAGASPFGLGSDIGGSLRMPAFFCGVYAHKPSANILPLTGHFPFMNEDFKRLVDDKVPYTALGPMARKATDLYPLIKLMMGPDGIDTNTTQTTLKPLDQNWSNKKIVICPSPAFHGTRSIDAELVQQVKNCGTLFTELGAEVVELDARFFVHAKDLWFSALKSVKSKNLFEMLFHDSPTSLGVEFFKTIFGKGNYTLPNLIVSVAEKAELKFKKTTDFSEDMKKLEQMKMELAEILGDNGILILPPHSRVAPKHRAPMWSPFDFISTGIFTTLGMPATVIPTGLNDKGLPLGVQVVARKGNDHLTLSCAEFLEQTFGGWVPPQIF
ncbi:MAG: amidase [Bdellovibrio sp.]|nr:amidase [Bdellovibrio sp.]